MSPVPQFKLDEDYVFETKTSHQDKSTTPSEKPSRNSSTSDLRVSSSLNVSFTRINVESSEIEVPELCESLNGNDENDRKSDKSNSNDMSASFRSVGYDIMGDVTIQTNLSLMSQLDLSSCGTPLSIFTEV